MIRKAISQDANEIALLSTILWEDNTAEDMTAEYEKLLSDDDCAVFICIENDIPIAFAQCQLRHDYVEGTASSPVGYLEGIFVKEGYRNKGIARELLCCCESWASEKGCSEFASDCELTNEDSLKFHLKTGFSEANRIICFTKKLHR